MEKPVIILGAKGIAKAAQEIFKSNNVIVYGFLEDDGEMLGLEIDDATVLGRTDDHGFLKLIGQKTEAFVATDDNALRKKHVSMLMETRKVMPTNAIHREAVISTSAVISHGNFINSLVSVGAEAKIGQHCILHAGAIIEHGVSLGDFVQVGPGAIVGSNVEVAKEAFIGAGAIIVSGVTIGKRARIGAGSVVIADVGDGETIFGNPGVKVNK